MTQVETITAWTAVVLYALTTMLFVYLVAFGRQRGERLAVILGGSGVVVHLVSLVMRGIVSGHIPVKGNYENASAAALFITVPAAIMALRKGRLRLIAAAAFPLALFVLGWGMLQHDPATPLTPAYDSTWLVIHVVFANLSYGAYSLACGAGICYLVKESRQRRQKPLKLMAKLPDLDDLDDYIFRFVVFGFITSAMMIVAGAFWADALWGSYWSWDPVETWSLVSWLTYGLYIHLRVVHRWRGRRMAWLAVVAIVFVLISFWGVSYLTNSFHIFLQI